MLSYPTVIDSGSDGPSAWAITLTVEEHRHVNEQVSFTTRSYCYEGVCSYPGPTIAVFPGDELTLTLVNKLGPELDGEEHIMNTMHSPNTTNMHTHGLHISPEVDTVFISAKPGESLTYPYKIAEDHAPGMHWYHAHLHGSTTFQVMSGMLGALEIKPIPSQNIPESITSADSHLIVLTHIKFNQELGADSGLVNQGCGPSFTCDPYVQAPLCTGYETESDFSYFRQYSYIELGRTLGSTMAVNEVFTDPDVQDMQLVNGMYKPTVQLVQGSHSIFRIIVASGGGRLYLTIKEGSGTCSMSVIAYDGVYLDALESKDTIGLVEASRADVQISCSQEGMFTLTSEGADIMYLSVSAVGTQTTGVTDDDLGGFVRPYYLQDLMGDDVKIDSHYSMHIWRKGFDSSVCGAWLGAGSDCSGLSPMGSGNPDPSSTVCPFGQFVGPRGSNPEAYTDAYKLVTPVNAINEWTIYGMVKNTLALTKFDINCINNFS